MGHKILRGERQLTVAQVKKLAAAFHPSPYFLEFIIVSYTVSLPRSA